MVTKRYRLKLQGRELEWKKRPQWEEGLSRDCTSVDDLQVDRRDIHNYGAQVLAGAREGNLNKPGEG
eukprot:950442-Prorocentrum_lima.AAC.1